MRYLYHLHAIFSSLQGEGRNVGRPATFIRFSSCNLACTWCDTHKSEKLQMSVEKIVAKVREFQPQAEIVVQETWSYTPWDKRLEKWGIDQNQMYEGLHDAYAGFARQYGIAIIPFGTAVQTWRRLLPVKYTENSFGGDVVGGGKQDERDNFKRDVDGKWVPNCDVFHLNRKGEYFQALVWAKTIFGVDLTDLKYKPDFVSDSDAKLMKEIAMGRK